MSPRTSSSSPFRTLPFFFFNDTATTEIYTLSLHERSSDLLVGRVRKPHGQRGEVAVFPLVETPPPPHAARDRKSTRLNSSHSQISYAVFCLKKKKIVTRRRRGSGRGTVPRTTEHTPRSSPR